MNFNTIGVLFVYVPTAHTRVSSALCKAEVSEIFSLLSRGNFFRTTTPLGSEGTYKVQPQ